MSESLRMHVMQPIEHLLEVGAGNVGREPPSERDEIKQFSASDVLQYNCEALIAALIMLIRGARLFLVGRIFPDVDQVDEILVVQLAQNAELVTQALDVDHFTLETFYGYELAVGGLC